MERRVVEIKRYCNKCHTCNSRKNPLRRKRHALGQRPTVWAPFQRMPWDHLSIAPSGRGFESLLVSTDSLTHWVEAIPTIQQTASEAARKMYEDIDANIRMT